MSEMKKTTVQITVADLAEEAMALNDFYRQRTLAVQSMRRSAAEEADQLRAQLQAANERLAAFDTEIIEVPTDG
jgi:hypothetical protein